MTAEGRREKKRRSRREEIIDAAERVIFLKGFEAAAVDDIAREARFTKRTLYSYFSSKEQLYDAVVLRGYQLLNRRTEERLSAAKPTDGLEKVMLIGQIFFEFIQEFPDYFKASVLYETQPDLATASEIRIANYQEGEVTAGRIIEAIRQGIEDGSIRSDLDPVSTSFILYSQVIGMGFIFINKRAYLEGFHGVQTGKMLEQLTAMIREILKS